MVALDSDWAKGSDWVPDVAHWLARADYYARGTRALKTDPRWPPSRIATTQVSRRETNLKTYNDALVLLLIGSSVCGGCLAVYRMYGR